MKIFVTGFQRSGTTLMKELIQRHPDVEKMWHETGLLKRSKKDLYRTKILTDKTTRKEREEDKTLGRTRKINIDFSLRNSNWGEKIPYRNYIIKKGVHISITEYCRRWNSYFLPDACIINIIRHPIDMGLSTKKIGYTKGIVKPINEFKNIGPKVINELREIPNILHVKYEDLLLKPMRTLRKIFRFCKLDASDKTIRKVISGNYINSSRAFTYKKQKVNIERLQLNKLIKFLNQIEGVKYNLRK